MSFIDDPAFEAFARANPNVVDDNLVEGQNPGAIYPGFRHFRYFAPRSVVDYIQSEIKQTAAPTTAAPTTAAPTTTAPTTTAPTQVPSSSASLVHSNSPTLSPLPSLVIIDGNGNDNLPACATDEAGSFMTESSGPYEENILAYKYSVITNPDMRARIEQEVLPSIETTILDAILPDLFKGVCGDRRSLQEKLRTSSRTSRRLAIVGASAQPPDLFSTSETCISEKKDYDCNIVEGKMQIFSDDNSDDYGSIETLLCSAMEVDDPSVIHPALVSLQCMERPDGNAPPLSDDPNSGTDFSSPNPASGSLAATPFILTTMSAVMVIFGVYFYRRRKNKGDDTPGEHLDDSDMNTSNSISIDAGAPINTWERKPKSSSPAFDLNSIIPSRGYKPETVEESAEEYVDSDLDEVSLNQLNMTVDD
eukprot:CAMPEP_0194101792 /NCGR_PEP_ID=MMETSP0150-20130528/2454_1 /TAXON_ID=122233 /ORGANISM="Chaetoceros debilis, Strain MM31A-1" /LENGTH=419 /DNA_ID=CAMNT_0038788513 /DNA_START=40 /DNA_END=1296 /DNA_ORIENTATION=+